MENLSDGQSGTFKIKEQPKAARKIKAMSIYQHIDRLIDRIPRLEPCREDIRQAYDLLERSFSAKGKLLVCGNGGSASDSEHIVGELMKEFKLKRKVFAFCCSMMAAEDRLLPVK